MTEHWQPEPKRARRSKAKGPAPAPEPMTRMQLRESILLRGDVRLGDVMDPWQREDFAALDDPACRRWYLERPRGHAKTSDAGTELSVELLLGPPDPQLYCVAMDEQQAGILLKDVGDKLRRGGYVERGDVRPTTGSGRSSRGRASRRT